MDFVKTYLDAVSQKRTWQLEANPIQLIPNQYSYEHLLLPEAKQDAFLRLLAGGNQLFTMPFSFSFHPLACHMLLYTETGSGQLSYAGVSVPLKEQRLLFFDCGQRFTLQSASLPWRFKIFFLGGAPLPVYSEQLKAKQASCFSLEEYSPIRKYLTQLLGIETNAGLYELIQMNQLFTDIFSSLYLGAFSGHTKQTADIPAYLIELKDFFDHHYKETFTLDSCQEHYNISKYRICREFSKYFGEPPLRYRNLKRLEAAKELLLTTEMNVHEISSIVGFENVNHFINLFKKENGNTPNAFKQTVLAGQSASRSPVQ